MFVTTTGLYLGTFWMIFAESQCSSERAEPSALIITQAGFEERLEEDTACKKIVFIS
jgi:hypothetical protein